MPATSAMINIVPLRSNNFARGALGSPNKAAMNAKIVTINNIPKSITNWKNGLWVEGTGGMTSLGKGGVISSRDGTARPICQAFVGPPQVLRNYRGLSG